MSTREEHLAWCKTRALEILEAGDREGALASMLSDLTKWKGPLYPPETLRTITVVGIKFCPTAGELRSWIEGFQ